jgi:hypothetical protein
MLDIWRLADAPEILGLKGTPSGRAVIKAAYPYSRAPGTPKGTLPYAALRDLA